MTSPVQRIRNQIMPEESSYENCDTVSSQEGGSNICSQDGNDADDLPCAQIRSKVDQRSQISNNDDDILHELSCSQSQDIGNMEIQAVPCAQISNNVEHCLQISNNDHDMLCELSRSQPQDIGNMEIQAVPCAQISNNVEQCSQISNNDHDMLCELSRSQSQDIGNMEIQAVPCAQISNNVERCSQISNNDHDNLCELSQSDEGKISPQSQDNGNIETCSQLSEHSDCLSSLSQETVVTEMSSQQSNDVLTSLYQQTALTEQSSYIVLWSQKSGVTVLSSQESGDMQSLSQRTDVTETSSQFDEDNLVSQETVVTDVLSQCSNEPMPLSQETGIITEQSDVTNFSTHDLVGLQNCSPETIDGSLVPQQDTVPSVASLAEHRQISCTTQNGNSQLHCQSVPTNSPQIAVSSTEDVRQQATLTANSCSELLTIPLNSEGCAQFMTQWKLFNHADKKKIFQIMQNEKLQREKRLRMSRKRLKDLRTLHTEIQSNRQASALKKARMEQYVQSEIKLKQDIAGLNDKLPNYERHRSQLTLQRYHLQLTSHALDSVDKAL